MKSEPEDSMPDSENKAVGCTQLHLQNGFTVPERRQHIAHSSPTKRSSVQCPEDEKDDSVQSLKLKQDNHTVEGEAGLFSVHNITLRTMFTITALLGIISAVLVYQFYSLTPSYADSLIESIENFGYSGQPVKRHSYGSPDLVTEKYKKELKARFLKKNSQHQENQEGIEIGMDRTENVLSDAGSFMNTVDKEDQYVVVFDAGSSGTRLHVYQFRFKEDSVELVNEIYQKVRPGLSEYVNDPNQGATSLQEMIDAAMESVPLSLHKSTPLIFKATAGFRLLNASSANNLLDEIRKRFAATNFDFNYDDINIMGDIEEGLFGWVTINYLLGKLDGVSSTTAALDLGGASTQVSYIPMKSDRSLKGMQQMVLLGKEYSVYTHSYLGIGLLAARNSTLTDVGDGTLASDCLPVGYSGIFTYGGKDHVVRGPEVPAPDGCWQQVGNFLSSQHILPLWDLIESRQNIDAYLFSYYYETLQMATVIGNETEKIVSVRDFYNAANTVCRSPDLQMPFLCQDLTYITRLLGEMFMLWNKPLHVVSEINSGETSWSLGAALDALSKMEA